MERRTFYSIAPADQHAILLSDRNTSIERDPVVETYKKDVDRTLLKENLRLSHEDRLLKLIEHQRFADELRKAGDRYRREHG